MRRTFPTLNLVLLVFFGVMANSLAQAETLTNIQQMAQRTCSVMAGQRKPDGQSMQYLLMLDDYDNPIAAAFNQEVIRQCPKTYILFNRRTRTNNPYPPGSLLR